MASPNQVFKQFPMPQSSQLLGFLASCPAFTWLNSQKLQLLASELKLVRYSDGARLFADQVPDHRSPLRFVVQGRATWDPSRSGEQKSAWMLTPGSAFGIEAVNDWALRHQLEGAWSRGEMPRIRCQAVGVLWVLELPSDRFDAAFMPGSGRSALARLLRMVGTSCNAPEVVAAMRKNPQFARTAAVHLYKLLEWAPTSIVWPNLDNLDLDLGEQQQQPGANALYYVIEGSLTMQVAEQTKVIQTGEMDGADLFAPPIDQLQVSIPKAMTKVEVITLTRAALDICLRQVPGMMRMLGPADVAQQVEP